MRLIRLCAFYFLQQDGQVALGAIVTVLRDSTKAAELALYCNREYDALDAQIDNMNSILSVLSSSMTRVLDLVSCPRIVPMYTDTSTCHVFFKKSLGNPHCILCVISYCMFFFIWTVYDASCEISTKALFWTFCSAVVVGTFGLLMISFRASYKLSENLDFYDQSPTSAKDTKEGDASERKASPREKSFRRGGDGKEEEEDDDDDDASSGSDESSPHQQEYRTKADKDIGNDEDDERQKKAIANAVDVD